MLEHYEVISDGRWPQKLTGYIDNPFVPAPLRSKSGAYFEGPVGILAELNSRLRACGRDGEMVLCLRAWGWDQDILMRLMRTDRESMELAERRVIAYVSYRRKERSYKEFCQH